MSRVFYALALLSVSILGTGCAMCENCHDYEYGAYGGICPDGACGVRVGSIVPLSGGKYADSETASQKSHAGQLQPLSGDPQPASSSPTEADEVVPLEMGPIESGDPPAEEPTDSLPPVFDPAMSTPAAETDATGPEGLEMPLPRGAGEFPPPTYRPEISPGTTPDRPLGVR